MSDVNFEDQTTRTHWKIKGEWIAIKDLGDGLLFSTIKMQIRAAQQRRINDIRRLLSSGVRFGEEYEHAEGSYEPYADKTLEVMIAEWIRRGNGREVIEEYEDKVQTWADFHEIELVQQDHHSRKTQRPRLDSDAQYQRRRDRDSY